MNLEQIISEAWAARERAGFTLPPSKLATVVKRWACAVDPMGEVDTEQALHEQRYLYASRTLDGGVKIVETAGRSPEQYMPALKEAGIKVIHKCTSVRHSLKAESIGCDAVSVDGFECGGHPGEDDVPNFILLPRAAEELKIPFVASGGTGPTGAIPTNTGGGHLSEGYIHGMNHVYEAVEQIRGDASTRQVDRNDVALLHPGAAFDMQFRQHATGACRQGHTLFGLGASGNRELARMHALVRLDHGDDTGTALVKRVDGQVEPLVGSATNTLTYTYDADRKSVV